MRGRELGRKSGLKIGHRPNGLILLYFTGVCGGDAGIRTLGTPYRVRRFSKPLPSATRPRLRQAGDLSVAHRFRKASATARSLNRVNAKST